MYVKQNHYETAHLICDSILVGCTRDIVLSFRYFGTVANAVIRDHGTTRQRSRNKITYKNLIMKKKPSMVNML